MTSGGEAATAGGVAARHIGVAVGIPQPYGAQLQDYRERFGDADSWAIVPHVTLLPPTSVPPDLLPAAEEHLARVAAVHPPFDIHLRGSGTFRPVSPVVFVTLVEGIAGCERLEAAVRSGPLGRSLRFPYHPHVTVAHDLPGDALDRAFDELAFYDVRFRVGSFQLYDRAAHGGWRVVRDYPLGSG